MIRELDEDEYYELFRESEGEKLYNAIKEVFDEFMSKEGYYKNCKDKIKQHIISILEAI